MPVPTNASRPAVPVWLLASLALLGVLGLGFFGWRSLTGRETDPGPAKKVTPGMYDLRAEAAKMRAAKEKGAANGP